MASFTRGSYQKHARVEKHPYRRLCYNTYAIFEMQKARTSIEEMCDLVKQGKQLFDSVALMHVCWSGNGGTACAMCADGDAYGNRRPKREASDLFPLLSSVSGVPPEMAPEYKTLLHAELHPYRRLCKQTHSVFEEQENCTTVHRMRRLAIEAMDLFDTAEVPQMHACQVGTCGPGCILCMERAAYGSVRPRDDI